LPGVNGNANNPGAPVVLNAGGDASLLGAPVTNQLVYSAHDFGPSEYQQEWFNSSTCYKSGCSSSVWLIYGINFGFLPIFRMVSCLFGLDILPILGQIQDIPLIHKLLCL
jgi:hypothetical protein